VSRGNRQQRGPQLPGQAPGRAPLHPADPLPGWKALMQAAILLGIPLTLLFVARLVLRKFFPSLGY
jgi:hypothetical protein